MHVLVQAAHYKHLLVVVHGLGPEELLGLFQRAVLPLNFVVFRVERVAVGDPALVASENQDLSVVPAREASNGVAGGPGVVFVVELDSFPLLLVEVCVAVQFFEGVQVCLSLTVASRNHKKIPTFNDTHRVEVTPLLELSNLKPLVLCNIIHLGLAVRVVGVLAAHRVNVVFRLVVVAAVELGQLVAALPVFHRRSPLNLERLFVQHQAVVSDNSPNLVLTELAADQEDFVLRLDAGKAARHNLCVADADLLGALVVQVVNLNHLELFVVVVKTRLLGLKDEVRLEGQDVMQESAEFVYLALDLDNGSGVVLHEVAVELHFVPELLGSGVEVAQIALFL